MSDSNLEKVLIIDDNSDYRKLIKTFINKLLPDVECIEYDPVFEGAPDDSFNWHGIDVLLLDYHLSIIGTTGLDILHNHHKNASFPATIMLTGAGTEEIAIRAFKSGIYEYQAKQSLTKDKLKELIIHAWENKKSERIRKQEITQHNRSFSKEVFYESLVKAFDQKGPERALVIISLDDVDILEEEIGIIGRDNLVNHIAKNSFEVFKLGVCNPNITRISDTEIGVQIDYPENEETLDFNMQGLSKHLAKCPYKFSDQKYKFSVSIGILKLGVFRESAERLINIASAASIQASKTKGNSHYFWKKSDVIAEFNDKDNISGKQSSGKKTSPEIFEEKENLEAELKAAAEAKEKAEIIIQAEQEAKKILETQLKAAEKAKEKAEAELKIAAVAKEKAEVLAKEEARKNASAELKIQEEIKIRAEQKAKEDADIEAKIKVQAEIQEQQYAKVKAGEEAKAQAELRAKQEAQQRMEAELKSETETKAKLQAELRAEQEAQQRMEAELKSETETKAKLQAELRAEQEAQQRIEAELKSETEAKAKLQAELRAEQEAQQRIEAELKSETEAKEKLQAETEMKAAKEEKEKLEAELKAVAEAKEKAEGEMKAAKEEKEKLEAQLKALKEVKDNQTEETSTTSSSQEIKNNKTEEDSETSQNNDDNNRKDDHTLDNNEIQENDSIDGEASKALIQDAEALIRKLIDEKRIIQTYQAITAMFDDETEIKEIYRIGLRAIIEDEDDNLNQYLLDTSIFSISLQQTINEWILRQVFLRITESSTTKCQCLFLINVTESWFSDIALFNWLQKILSQTKKYHPGKSIMLDVPLDVFNKHQKRAQALIGSLHKSHQFSIALSNIHAFDNISENCVLTSASLLMMNIEQLQKLTATPAPHSKEENKEKADEDSEKPAILNMLQYLKSKDIRIITSGIEDSTLLIDAISAGTDYTLGSFVGEIQDNLVDSHTVESFELK